MATSVLIHNPTAGKGKHGKEELLKAIKSFGYEVQYFSTDVPGWEKFTEAEAEKIFVAGGDGTVQKVAAELLKVNDRIRKTPVQVLPLGTANNIASTLNFETDFYDLRNFKQTTGLDVGQVEGIEETDFFIEAIGAGIFPKLVKAMEAEEKKKGEPRDPEEEMRQSLQELMRIVEDYEPAEAIIIADGEELTGRYLLVEIMNIRFIGPNLELAPNAETGDGEFELVAIPEEGREALLAYLKNILHKRENDLSLGQFAELRKVKEIRFKWKGKDFHVDDDVIDIKGGEVQIKNRREVFVFCIPERNML